MKLVFDNLIEAGSITPENPKGTKVSIEVDEDTFDFGKHMSIRLAAWNSARRLKQIFGEQE